MIDLKNRVVYVHIPKTAGTSIEKYFLNSRGLKFEDRAALGIFKNDLNSSLERANSHSSLSDLESYYFGGEIPSDYRIFTVVRDPYKRFWSEWSYRRIPNPKRYPVSFYLPVKTLTRLAKNPVSRLKDLNSHMRPQWSFLTGKATNRVRILRFETLAEDFRKMQIEWELPQGELPRENKSSRKRVPTAADRKIGDDFVRQYYAEDFTNLNYEM